MDPLRVPLMKLTSTEARGSRRIYVDTLAIYDNFSRLYQIPLEPAGLKCTLKQTSSNGSAHSYIVRGRVLRRGPHRFRNSQGPVLPFTRSKVYHV